jgi:flagella basal body P-ring formation protein FlgA
VPVAARDLAAGAMLRAADLRVEARATAGGWDVSPAALAGARLLRPLAAGQPIVEADVAVAAPVSAGTHVTVLVRSGRLTVSAEGVLERPARPGETAAARVSGRLVRGRLAADRQTLLVEKQ